MIVGPTSTVVQLCRPNRHALGPYAWPTMTGQRSQHKSSTLAGYSWPYFGAEQRHQRQHISSVIRRFVLRLGLRIVYCQFGVDSSSCFPLKAQDDRQTIKVADATCTLSSYICENLTDHLS